jgi:hypothetical protein
MILQAPFYLTKVQTSKQNQSPRALLDCFLILFLFYFIISIFLFLRHQSTNKRLRIEEGSDGNEENDITDSIRNLTLFFLCYYFEFLF